MLQSFVSHHMLEQFLVAVSGLAVLAMAGRGGLIRVRDLGHSGAFNMDMKFFDPQGGVASSGRHLQEALQVGVLHCGHGTGYCVAVMRWYSSSASRRGAVVQISEAWSPVF